VTDDNVMGGVSNGNVDEVGPNLAGLPKYPYRSTSII
jgi:hypothetical protein